MYEYGSRVGFWRAAPAVHRAAVPITVFGVAMALERNPDAVAAMLDGGWEVASHGYRWIDHHGMPEDEEREHIRKVVEIHERVVGTRPLGHFLGRRSENTVSLVAEEGGFVYSQDSYADELPYWVVESGSRSCSCPTRRTSTTIASPRRRASTGASRSSSTSGTLRRALRGRGEGAEGDGDRTALPAGRKTGSVRRAPRFVEHVQSHDDVWLCRGIDIAKHWRERFPPPA